ACRQKDAQHARVVIAKVNLLAVGKLNLEKMAEVAANLLNVAVAGEIDSPTVAPAFEHERAEQEGILLQVHQIGRDVGQLVALDSFVQRLMLLLGLHQQSQNLDVAGCVENG